MKAAGAEAGVNARRVSHQDDIAATAIEFFRNAAFAQSSRSGHAFCDQVIDLVQFCFHEKAFEKFQMGRQ